MECELAKEVFVVGELDFPKTNGHGVMILHSQWTEPGWLGSVDAETYTLIDNSGGVGLTAGDVLLHSPLACKRGKERAGG